MAQADPPHPTGFLIYCAFVGVFASAMIYRVAPRYGRKNPLVYLSICSTVGSISIMAIKAFGIALKLTLRGDNQFTHASTYVFLIVVAVCILTQMNYFNKALSQFSTNVYVSSLVHTPQSHDANLSESVNPLYYVLFTSATILASLILFGGFNTTDAVNTISLLCGFLVIFTGVYLLNMCRDSTSDSDSNPGSRDGDNEDASKYLFDVDGVPTDGLAGLQTRRSMQLRRSMESANGHYRSSSGSLSFARGESHRLMSDYAREEHGGAKGAQADGAPKSPAQRSPAQQQGGGPFGRWSDRRRTLSRDHYDLHDLAEDPETEDEEARALATPTNRDSEDGKERVDGGAGENGNGNGNGNGKVR